ncbi:hemin uptake protein HemP [Tianweitania sediminis]|nr:hemin uptake protein HemP [Tianweitania sediminis]
MSITATRMEFRPQPRQFAAAPAEHRQPVLRSVRTLASDSLFHGATEIGIEHRGSLYRLKITRQGKLILNK